MQYVKAIAQHKMTNKMERFANVPIKLEKHTNIAF